MGSLLFERDFIIGELENKDAMFFKSSGSDLNKYLVTTQSYKTNNTMYSFPILGLDIDPWRGKQEYMQF